MEMLQNENPVYTRNDINTHVFNFRKENITIMGFEIKSKKNKAVLPRFILDKMYAKDNISMLLSSGDWVIDGVSNVAKYSDYDIHVCYPEPATDSKDDKINPLDKNVEDALNAKDKIICFVDYLDDSAVRLLVETFSKQITRIDTLDNRISPTYDSIISLLHNNACITKSVLTGIKHRIEHDSKQKAKSGVSSVKWNSLPNGGGFSKTRKRYKLSRP